MSPDANEPSEYSELLSRFGHGNDSALAQLVARETPRLLRRIDAALPAALRARVGASDIFQQTLIDLVGMQERFDNRGTAAFRKLMLTLAEARIARAVRRERALKRDVYRESTPQPGPVDESLPGLQIAADQSTPSQIAIGVESSDRLRIALARLSAADREIIELIDYQDLNFETAAARLGIELKTAQKRHERALARMKELMKRSAN
ncbi:MAG: RNA polymerase sigma factor [Planctomycetota bacterium]